MATIDSIQIGEEIYTIKAKTDTNNSNLNDATYRWQYVSGEISPNTLYNHKTKSLDNTNLYTSIRYVFNGEKKVRISGANSGSTNKLAYVFLDETDNIISKAEFVSGETYRDIVLDVPQDAYEIRINGNTYVSPHLEVALEDLMSDIRTLPYLLHELGKRLQYKDKFAWKPMDTGHITFTFDDSLDDVSTIVDLFVNKGVPCCFGAIPEKLNMGLSNGETIAQAMQRGIDSVGCEVLAHGSSSYEIVTEDNIDDMNFLYNKFVINKKKFEDHGFNVRGTVRVGGSGNICGDSRTDEWVRLFFDYGDLYGIKEPHNHARESLSTGLDGYKAAIDEAIVNKEFCPLLFHKCPEYMEELIDYALSQGAVICTYAYAYDNYGSTESEVSILNRLKALENNNTIEIPEEKTLLSIFANKTKTTYNTGEVVDTDDITVIARYSNGTSENITEESIINTSLIDTSTAGTYEITISYNDKITKISITISDDSFNGGGEEDSSVEYIINNASFNGGELSGGDIFGPEISVVAGESYSIEADYDFTTTVQYSNHNITLTGCYWTNDTDNFKSNEGQTIGHLSTIWTAKSTISKLLFKITMFNTGIIAYNFTNVYVKKIVSE